jgi:hypothetical protein
MADGMLLTRRERRVLFWQKLGAAYGPVLVLAAFAALTGGGTVAVVCLIVGGLIAVCVVTTVRTARGALWGGIATALFLLVVQLAIAWLVSHPIIGD